MELSIEWNPPLTSSLKKKISTTPPKPRLDRKEVKQNHLVKNDLYIRLLAVKPFKCLFDHYDLDKTIAYSASIKQKITNNELSQYIQTGVGGLLIESTSKQFPEANLTLDTRKINENARGFYEHLGFHSREGLSFGGSNPVYYLGYEKACSMNSALLKLA